MYIGTSLAVQWLGLRASIAGDVGSIPGWGTKVLQGAAKINKYVYFKAVFLKIGI